MTDFIKRFQQWNNSPTLPTYLQQELIDIANDSHEIEERFYQYLSFGTGGMRGLLGAGTNRMNLLTIRRVAEGIALFIKRAGQDAMQRGVVIAYDTRHYSEQFALECAKTIGKYGIKVYLFTESRPTPQLSFAIRHLHAYAGIVITASHNPSSYNGIKVYGEDGGQLAINTTQSIVEHINTIEDLLTIPIESKQVLLNNNILTYILSDVDQAYQKQLLALRNHKYFPTKEAHKLTIVFTPLHGSGLFPVLQGLQQFGFHNVSIVDEQAIQDPNFPTVQSPNPEERDAFELAIHLGKQINAELLLATDPDADRLGVAILDPSNNYRLLNGNELGALLLHYILTRKMEQDELPVNGVVLKTIVTSELGRAIAKKFNSTTIDTLTGFKFISEKIEEFNTTGEYEFLFGYEESYGYLISDFARDKDAVQAAVLTAEMAAHYKSNNSSIYDALRRIYEEFGYYKESIQSITAEGKDGQATIKKILTHFREHPPLIIIRKSLITIEDYNISKRLHVNAHEETLLLPKENVLKLFFEDDCWICIRPSGTEPKCKFYFGVKEQSNDMAVNSLTRLQSEFMAIVAKI